jgi:hypothetical protein
MGQLGTCIADFATILMNAWHRIAMNGRDGKVEWLCGKYGFCFFSLYLALSDTQPTCPF